MNYNHRRDPTTLISGAIFIAQYGLEQPQSNLPLSKITSFPAPISDPVSTL
jgi:hypothetical protein